MSKKTTLFILLATVASTGVAQQPSQPVVSPLFSGYEQRAEHFLDFDLNAATIDQLQRVLNSADAPALGVDDQWTLLNALYYRNNPDTPDLLRKFINNNPTADVTLQARLLLADWYFFRGEYPEAVVEYEKCNPESFASGDFANYTYRYGLSLIKAGDIDRGERQMKHLLKNSTYSREAKYYLGYVAYMRGDYNQAAELFKSSGLDASYYLTQIDFHNGNFEAVTEKGIALLKNPADKSFIPELRRIIGESFYNLDNHDAAQTYLEAYIGDNTTPHNNSAVYDLGVIRYENGDYEGAAKLFSLLTDERDAVGQSANLYMGQCEMMLNHDNTAAMFFRKAYERSFDNSVTETAFYNYLTSVARGGNAPFASTAGLCEEFLKNFPNSQYANNVKEYLAISYYKEKDYVKALANINRIQNPTAKVLAAKQKILYDLGVQNLSNGNSADAERYFNQCIDMKATDRDLALEAELWLGDALFQQKKYGQAAKSFESYAKKASKSANRSLALYDLAYAVYMQEDYKQAAAKFAEALSASPALPKALADDARIRRADCLYYTRNYKEAHDLYSKAIADGATEADYATYRRAVVYGLLGDVKTKMDELASIPKKFPGSRWNSTTLLEKAVTLQSEGKTEEAITTYDNLVESYPDAPETRNGMLQLAMTLNKNGNSSRAMEVYKEIISKWPTSEEALLANNDLKRLAASNGSLKDYTEFILSIPNAPAIDPDELDRISFETAQQLLFKNDTSGLKRYIADYPNGTYLAQALFDLADIAAEAGNTDESIEWINTLNTKRPDSRMATSGAAVAARALEKEGRADEALSYWRLLLQKNDADFTEEAMAGIMRLSSDPEQQLEYARSIQKDYARDASKREEAMLYEARALAALGRTQEATEKYNEIFANGYSSTIAARAAFELGQYLYDTEDYANAIAVLDEFTNDSKADTYWLGRAYITLADAYKASGDDTFAKEYMEWLKKNYPGNEKDIRQMIETRLKEWK